MTGSDGPAAAGWPAVVVPVRDGAELLATALRGLVPAAAELGGRVVVVDDASSDRSGAVALDAGAELVRLDQPSGPYVARNAGWQHAAEAGASVAVFVDARCRPTPGWLPALLTALAVDGAALAAGEVTVLPRPHLAGRAATLLQPLALRHGREAAFLPYAPTCHLAVPIRVLRAVDGFRPVRGGGDVDLCWRVQLSGAGSMAWADDAVLEWEPRDRVRDLLSQHRRYGTNTARLRSSFAADGCPVPPAAPRWRIAAHHVRALTGDARRARPASWAPLAVAQLARAAHDLGYAAALDEQDGEDPAR